MEKRTVKFGVYDTAANGWTLTGCTLSDPEMKQNYVEKVGADGSWDLSTALTDGIPKYKDRSLVVTLECSEGDREEREGKINHLVNLLDGMRQEVVLPDRPDHYLVGRLATSVGYSDLAHAQVTVSGTCSPWFYSARQRRYALISNDQWQKVYLRNTGRRPAALTVEVENILQLQLDGGAIVTLEAGVHQRPDLQLTQGTHLLLYSGTGVAEVTYREAVLR